VLVLSRKIDETVVIGGNIRVTMVSIRGRQVRLAIEAPTAVTILREELVQGSRQTTRGLRLASDPSMGPPPKPRTGPDETSRTMPTRRRPPRRHGPA
jgi:carbon storage regulator